MTSDTTPAVTTAKGATGASVPSTEAARAEADGGGANLEGADVDICDEDAKQAGVKAVREQLGVKVAARFAAGVRLLGGGGGGIEELKLSQATEHLVAALELADEGRVHTEAYGELALAYGRALLCYVIRRASAGGVLGGDVEGELKKGRAVEEEEVEEEVEEEEGEGGDGGGDEEDAWTQLEIARVAFEKAGCSRRLGVVHGVLGDFLLACDQAAGAGEEFEKAASLGEGRGRAESLYKRFLALRREDGAEALASLRESVGVMKGVEGVEDVVADMAEELAAFEKVVEGRGADSARGEVVSKGGWDSAGERQTSDVGADQVAVVTVLPKRKRDAAKAEEEANGEEANGVKKVRLEDAK